MVKTSIQLTLADYKPYSVSTNLTITTMKPLTLEQLKFTDGVIVFRAGNMVVGKAYDRNEFFKNTRYANSFTQFPYSVEIPNMGIRECKDLQEVLEVVNKYCII